MITFNKFGWETKGKIQELRNKARNGEISNRIYLLCWQIVAYGDDYVKKLDSEILGECRAILESQL